MFWLDSKSHGFSYSWNMLEHVVVFPMGSRHSRGDENDCKKRPVWHFKFSGCVLVAATVNVKINKKEDKTYKARTRFTMLAVCLPPCKQSRAKTYGRRPACRSPYIHSLKARCVKSRDCYLIGPSMFWFQVSLSNCKNSIVYQRLSGFLLYSFVSYCSE